jgi:thiopeptide-type bacteriocin biosynthesis protein
MRDGYGIHIRFLHTHYYTLEFDLAERKCLIEMIYIPTQKYMLRIPLQPTSFLEKYMNIEEDYERIKEDAFFNEQLLVASSSIYKMLHENELNQLSNKKKRQLISSLLCYQNRAAHRTTPFGLFTGVALIKQGAHNIADNEELNFIKHCRVDIEWLLGYVKDIIKENYSIFKYKVNAGYYRLGNRNHLFYLPGEKTESISIHDSKPFQIIEEACSDKFMSFESIMTLLKSIYPNRDENTIHNYVKALIEKQFLIAEVSPPLCNTDELEYVLTKMKCYPEILKNNIDDLEHLKNMISDYCKTNMGEGIDQYLQIRKKMDEIYSKEKVSFLQVDCQIDVSANLLDDTDIKKIQKFINYIFRLSAIYKPENPFDDYKLKFVEKYGEYIEVPIYELIDESFGIGAPEGYKYPLNQFTNSVINHEENVTLKSFFMNKYTESVKTNTPIILDDRELDTYASSLEEVQYPDSLELNFILKQGEESKLLYLGPNCGSQMAGKTMGRFSYISSQYEELIEEISDRLAQDDDTDSCEISYIPDQIRHANVTRVVSKNTRNISFFTNSYDISQEVQLNNIVVGCKEDKLYLRDRESGRKLKVTTNHMLNRMASSNVIRLMQDISLSQNVALGEFPWERYYSELTYIPEIRYENVVVSCEKWRIVSDSVLPRSNKTSLEEFTSSFSSLKSKLGIPDQVYYKEADNRLLLDLTQERYISLLYSYIQKRPLIEIENIEKGDNLYKNKNEDYTAECVIPFIKASKQQNLIPTNNYASVQNTIQYLPFDSWLYLKLYGPLTRQNELIKYLQYHVENEANYISKFYFMRYADPKPHIRFRVQADQQLLFQFLNSFNELAKSLIHDRVIDNISIGTYIPEIERYGGLDSIQDAESLFHLDSTVVMNIINNFDVESDSEKIGVISIIHFLNSLGLSMEEQIQLLSQSARTKENAKDFNLVRREYIEELDSYEGWKNFKSTSKLASILPILNQRVEAASQFIKQLRSVKQRTNTLEDIIGSILHLHCNRLFGIDKEIEQKVLFFARQTLIGQKHLIESTIVSN